MDKKKLLVALPPEARRKLDALNRRSLAAYAEMRGINDEVHAARDSLHHFQVVRGRGQRRPPDEDAVEKARNDAAETALKEEIQRLQNISDEASQRTAPLRELVGRCFAWVEAIAGVGGKIVEIKPSIPGRETLASIRQKLTALDDQIEQVERAPAPAGELLALALAGIDRMAAAGAPIVAAGERVNDPIGLFDKLRLASLVPVENHVGIGALMPTAAEFLAWALADVLKERVTALIGTVSRPGALDTKAREEKLHDLADQKITLERTEEALICGSENGGFIPRRSDCDVRAVLGVIDA